LGSGKAKEGRGLYAGGPPRKIASYSAFASEKMGGFFQKLNPANP